MIITGQPRFKKTPMPRFQSRRLLLFGFFLHAIFAVGMLGGLVALLV